MVEREIVYFFDHLEPALVGSMRRLATLTELDYLKILNSTKIIAPR